MSDSLVNGSFGAIGANGDNKWRQWMLHVANGDSISGANGDHNGHWRHPLATMAIAIDDHWRHLIPLDQGLDGDRPRLAGPFRGPKANRPNTIQFST